MARKPWKKELKAKLDLGVIIQLWTTLLHLGSLWRSVTIIKPISYVASLTLVGWKEINCNIGVKQGCPLSPTLFGIYINKLEGCLEEAGCVNTSLVGIVIILLLYVDDIVLMVRSPYDLNKQLKFSRIFSLVWV
jgi:hypothetical protein